MKKPVAFYIVLFLSLFIACLAMYWPALSGGPLVDDFRLLASSKHGGWFDNFSTVVPGSKGIFWRPLVSVLLKLEWLTFQQYWAGYRLVSVLLCTITAFVEFLIVFRLTKVTTIAVASAFFFVLWPSHPETMVWIAGQCDGLATCFAAFAVWCFLCFWLGARSLVHGALTVLFLGLALLSKESIVILPAVIFFIGAALLPKGRNAAKHVVALAGAMVLATAGYLALRASMIHTSMLGGGYEDTIRHGPLDSIWRGLITYHVNFALLNTYLPLTNRILPPGMSPDTLIIVGLTFVVAALLRCMSTPSTSQTRMKQWIPILLIALLVSATYKLFGYYPIAFILSLAEIPMGIFAIALILLLIVALIVRNWKQTRQAYNRLCEMAINKPWIYLFSCLVAALVVYSQAADSVAHPLPYTSLFIFWLIAYLTGPNISRPKESKCLISKASLTMIGASFLALLPVLVIRQVDSNLVNARLYHLSTLFSIPAIVSAIWALGPNLRVKQMAIASAVPMIVIATHPSIRTWALSARISSDFVEAIKKSTAPRMYILVSPGFIPSSTTLLLGGEEVDVSGALIRHDNFKTVPGFYVDGFTVGDRLTVTPIDQSAWRIKVQAGDNRYRSGHLTLMPCYVVPQKRSAAYNTLGKHDSLERDVQITDPAGEILAVTEAGVVILRAK